MQPDHEKNSPDKDSADLNEMYAPATDFSENESDKASHGPVTGAMKSTSVEAEPIHWSADEYVHREKNGLWFGLFALAVLSFIAVDVLFIKSYTFSVLMVVMAISVVVYSQRPPKNIDYTLSGEQGLYVGQKLYHFSNFKSFGLIQDGGQHMIMLIPTKRFAPSVSVYFPEEMGEKIVDILGVRLPMETLKLDMIDVIVRKLRL